MNFALVSLIKERYICLKLGRLTSHLVAGNFIRKTRLYCKQNQLCFCDLCPKEYSFVKTNEEKSKYHQCNPRQQLYAPLKIRLKRFVSHLV